MPTRSRSTVSLTSVSRPRLGHGSKPTSSACSTSGQSKYQATNSPSASNVGDNCQPQWSGSMPVKPRTHKPIRPKRTDRRPYANKRGYDHSWRCARAAYIAAHPLCEDCLAKGRIVPTYMVHHVIPIADGGEILDFRNFKALCRLCHDKTDHGKRKQGGGAYSTHFPP